jgi:two-component system nitrate/nitrite sensor histidine kinase NarX
MYQELEQRVREKTSDLERSNRSLELLYKTSRQLSEAPISDTVYEGLLRDIEELAGTGRGSICLGESGDSQAFKLATTRPPVFDRPDICNPPNCQGCFEGNDSHFVEVQSSESELLRVFSTPIKDMERQYGVLLLEVPHDKPLQKWQRRLLETVASHIAIAINMAQRTSQARMLALLEERSVIARELHDSLAQSLSYLKIQVSRLDAALTQPDNGDKIKQVASELRDGLNSAYRQLRELLTTFRLRMDEAGLNAALEKTVDEFRERGKVDIELDNHLGGCKLGPNAEIHVIQVVREALSNVVRHAHAEHAVVSARCDVNGNVSVAVDDDGVGMPDETERQHHYGLAIMQERARGVEGELKLIRSALGGTRVELRFSAARKSEAVDNAISRLGGDHSE